MCSTCTAQRKEHILMYVVLPTKTMNFCQNLGIFVADANEGLI